MELYDLREDYGKFPIDSSGLPKDPMVLFEQWLNLAIKEMGQDANTMILSTVSRENKPSSRVVLLKYFDEKGFVFFTNYKSKKGNDIERNPKVAILFFWTKLQKQIRIEGVADKSIASFSDRYFNKRPLESRISAIVSEQSQEIESLGLLENRMVKLRESGKIERPAHWGGYIVQPQYFEFWQGGASRLHQRITYTQEGEAWKQALLSP